MSDFLILLVTGAGAGFVDSIAGGGGLITLPVLTFFFGVGVQAIGTNKIVGTLAAVLALGVYFKANSRVSVKTWVFVAIASLGSGLGSLLAPHLPTQSFKILLTISLPLILISVWKKELWAERRLAPTLNKRSWIALVFGGLLCGVYDGAWGPGGGTFMFLTLLFFARLALFEALIASKLANTITAGTALVSYYLQGVVHWRVGLVMGFGAAVGAFFGARFATRNTSRIIRPVLAVVALLLAIKVISST